MKIFYLKIVFILIAFFNIDSANAQYQSIFGSSQTSWNVKTDQLFGAVNDSISYISDTIISTLTYKKVKYYREASEMETYLVKEDTTLGKVSYRKLNDTTHYEVYDLSLSLGNLFNGYIVDSVYTNLERKHIRLNHTPSSTSGEKFVMIEGVGTNVGLMYHNGMAGNLGAFLLCQHKDNAPNFINTHTIYNGQCNVGSVGISESNLDTKITVFPNPTSYLLNIMFKKDIEIQKVSILNMDGKTLKTFTRNFKELNIKGISSGVIFLKIYTYDQIITKKVIIK